jgi:hypothetical protein
MLPKPGVTLQVTAVFEVPLTVAENCRVVPKMNDAAVGLMVTTTGGCTRTAVVALFVGSATLVALIVTGVETVTAGAV